MNNETSSFTLAGRLLAVTCILLPIASVTLELAYRSTTGDDRTPSVPMLIFRDAVGGLLAFRFLSFVLRRCGAAIRMNDQTDDRGKVIPKPREDFAEVANDGKRYYYCSNCGQDMEIDEDARCMGCRYTV